MNGVRGTEPWAIGPDPEVARWWSQLENEERNVAIERRRLQEIWVKISAMHKANDDARAAFEKATNFNLVAPDTRLMLNVGGHIFETTAGVLCRDRFSLLAALCRTKPPIERDHSGAFFIDRDWWVFRYVLQFLRSGALPSDAVLLREMHAEAVFYRLSTLRRAVQAQAAHGPSAPPLPPAVVAAAAAARVAYPVGGPPMSAPLPGVAYSAGGFGDGGAGLPGGAGYGGAPRRVAGAGGFRLGGVGGGGGIGGGWDFTQRPSPIRRGGHAMRPLADPFGFTP